MDLVVPVKPLHAAKTRLRGVADHGVGDPDAHAALALALAHDTVAAVLAARTVRRLLVISSDPVVAAELAAVGVEVAPDVVGGLNAALLHGAAILREADPGTPVGALQADLPALRPSELDEALHDAAALFASGARRAFCPDAQGTGTTLLLAAAGAPLDPRFGAGSAARHRASGAVPLVAGGAGAAARRRHRRRPVCGRRAGAGPAHPRGAGPDRAGADRYAEALRPARSTCARQQRRCRVRRREGDEVAHVDAVPAAERQQDRPDLGELGEGEPEDRRRVHVTTISTARRRSGTRSLRRRRHALHPWSCARPRTANFPGRRR